MLAILVLGIYYIATSLRKNELNNIEFINKDFKITQGIVTRKSVQKGNHLWVKYNVDGKEYVNSDGFIWYQKFNVGDTIRVKYSKTKPELMITEFNEYF
ncbi:hypothetical protein CHRYSEOSP005_06330 [Chryseobacterium sp. Alg-005]